MFNNNERLSLTADTMNNNGLPLNLRLDNFRLKNISDIAISDTSFIDGSCNGTVSIESLNNFLFTSALKIDSLKLSGIDAGNLTLNVKQQQGSVIAAAIDLQGYGNNVQVTGSYNTELANADLDLNLQEFNLKNIGAFTQQYVVDLEGKLKGRLKISGTIDKPELNGNIQLDSIKAVYKDYNSFVKIPAAVIQFAPGGMKLQDFEFMDSAGNKGNISGYLATSDYRSYMFDLAVKATNFEAVGARKFPEQMLYGPARADINLTLKGTEKKFFIDGGVTLAEKSDFTYVYQLDDNILEGDGLIEFFDPSHPTDSATKKNKTQKAAATSYGMSMNIKATPSSTVVVMMDELTGDHFKLKGNADLNVTKEPGGQMYISGKYTLEEGIYDLSLFQLIRKQFSIQKGSSITWSGDPLKAAMDITAVYKTKTTAAELLTDMQATGGAGKQKMNFEVYLKLEKELLKPAISFKLDMPSPDNEFFNGVIFTRIKQINSIPAELNKQVMGLLAINSFIADNPFSSLSGSAAGSLETSIYSTAGELLTKELSGLLNSHVKGVDIDLGLDVNEDYTSGTAQRNTNLKLGISKSLANNRLSIYVGSSFALEGQNQNANAVDGLAGNIILEYLLTGDGKYRVKGFRTTESELTLQSTVIKTGASFVIVFEFNKRKQLFNVKKKNK